MAVTTQQQRDDLPPKVLQLVGLFGIIGCAIFWGAADRLEPTLIAAFGTLAVYGQYTAARNALKRNGNGNGAS